MKRIPVGFNYYFSILQCRYKSKRYETCGRINFWWSFPLDNDVYFLSSIARVIDRF